MKTELWGRESFTLCVVTCIAVTTWYTGVSVEYTTAPRSNLWNSCGVIVVFSCLFSIVCFALAFKKNPETKQKQKLLCTFECLSINRFCIPQLVSFLLLFCLPTPKNHQTNKNSKHRAHAWLLDPVSVITGCGNSHFRVLRSELNTQTRTTHRRILIHLTPAKS